MFVAQQVKYTKRMDTFEGARQYERKLKVYFHAYVTTRWPFTARKAYSEYSYPTLDTVCDLACSCFFCT